MAIGFTFILAGLGKVLDIKTSSNFAANLGIFPKPFGRVMGFIMPFIELPIGIVLSLGYSSDLIKFSTLFLLLFFLALNIKSLIDRKDISCFCFGHILSTRLGLGGAYHYLFLILMLIPIFFLDNITLVSIIYSHNISYLISIIFPALGLFITGLIIRAADFLWNKFDMEV
jgi:uncharacterized membrane protein YphA (DoxX/SURF4 family)